MTTESPDNARWVTVKRTTDPVELEIVLAALADAGIPARGLGTRNAALIGAGQLIMKQRVEVSEVDADEARALLEFSLDIEDDELSRELPPELAGDDASEEDGALGDGEVGARLRPKNRLLAAGSAFAIPGGAQMYIGRPWGGVTVLVAVLATLALIIPVGMGGGEWWFELALVVTYAGLVLADVLVAQVAFRRAVAGQRLSRFGQVLRGLLVVTLAASLGAGAALVAPEEEPRPPRKAGAPGDYGSPWEPYPAGGEGEYDGTLEGLFEIPTTIDPVGARQWHAPQGGAYDSGAPRAGSGQESP